MTYIRAASEEVQTDRVLQGRYIYSIYSNEILKGVFWWMGIGDNFLIGAGLTSGTHTDH